MTEIRKRTAAATATRMRASEEKLAAKLRDRGWLCVRPAPGTRLCAIAADGQTYRVIDQGMEGALTLEDDRGQTFVADGEYVLTLAVNTGPR